MLVTRPSRPSQALCPFEHVQLSEAAGPVSQNTISHLTVKCKTYCQRILMISISQVLSSDKSQGWKHIDAQPSSLTIRSYPVPAFSASLGTSQKRTIVMSSTADSVEGGRRLQIHDAGLGSELVVESELIIGCCGSSSEWVQSNRQSLSHHGQCTWAHYHTPKTTRESTEGWLFLGSACTAFS